MAALRDWRMWSEDRIHMTTEGHRRVALAALSRSVDPAEAAWATPLDAGPVDLAGRDRPRANALWAREYVGPWVQRRLRGQSSGDAVSAKRPNLLQPVPGQPDPSPRLPDLVLPSRRSGP